MKKILFCLAFDFWEKGTFKKAQLENPENLGVLEKTKPEEFKQIILL